MALIPLSEIPNAANITNLVAIPQAGANTNLTSSLGELQQSPMALDSFSGSARGLEALGESGKRVAAVFGDFSLAMAHANDVSGAASATNIMDSAYANHMAAMQKDGVPPDQWAAKWTSESLPKAQDAISKIQVSPRAAESLNAQVSVWGTNATSKINLAGIGQHIQNGKSELLVAMNNAEANGNYEGLYQMGQSGVDSHLLSQAQWDGIKEQYHQKQIQNNLTLDMQANPLEFSQAAEQAAKTGKWPGHEEIEGNHVLVSNVAWQSKRVLGQAVSETVSDIQGGIQSGDIKTEQDVEKAATAQGVVLNPKQMKEAKNWLKLNVPYDAEKTSDLRGDILKYDPTTDHDLSQMYNLQNRIGTEITPNLRPDLSAMLNKQGNGTNKNTDVDSRVSQMGSQFLQSGLWGAYKEGDSAAKLTGDKLQANQETMQKAQLQRAKFDDAYQAWSNEHPGATVEQGVEWANKYMQSAIEANAANKPKEDSGFEWNPMNWFKPTPSPTRAEDFIKEKTMKPQASLSPDTVDFVKNLEGFTPKASFDYKQNSVGYGTRAKSAGETLTESEATDRLKDELSMHSERIDKAVDSSGISLTPAQRTALISFDFNTGKGADLIETSDSVEEIAKRIAKYTKVTVKGKLVENKGLVNRRAAELELFNS